MFTGRVLFYVIFAFFASLTVTFGWTRIAPRIGMVDRPAVHKIHNAAVPRGGGISFAIVWLAAAYLSTFLTGLAAEVLRPALAIAVGATVLVAVGLRDDFRELGPVPKLIGQAIAAGVALAAFAFPAGIAGLALAVVYFLWIIGLTNAFNLIDGLDGLAAGIAVIVAGLLTLVGLVAAKPLVVAFSAILFMSCLGFLIFNWHPAKIFMGDTGSLFLGYALGTIGLISLSTPPRAAEAAALALLLAVPIFDTVLSIARRTISGRPIIESDKLHFYNVLMLRGFSYRATVATAYGLALLLGMSGLLQLVAEPALAIPVALIAVSLLALFTMKLRLLSAG